MQFISVKRVLAQLIQDVGHQGPDGRSGLVKRTDGQGATQVTVCALMRAKSRNI